MLKKDTALPLEEVPNDPAPALTKEAAANHSDALFAEFYRTRDTALREQLVELHMNLVRFLARKYANRGEPLEDLTQVGSIGLLNAIDRFDPTRGIRFATFATPTILGEIRRYFRDRGWAVKVPRRLQEVNLAATRAADSLTQTLRRAPTFAEIAQAIGSTEEETIEALEISSFYEPISLESEFDDGLESASVLGDYVGEEDSRIEALDLQERLQDALSRLAPRERAIVEMRFLRNLSQMEVAKRLKISQMHVSRLQQRALAKLRQIVKEL
jgi:RNA polymerase sigma-B factor